MGSPNPKSDSSAPLYLYNIALIWNLRIRRDELQNLGFREGCFRFKMDNDVIPTQIPYWHPVKRLQNNKHSPAYYYLWFESGLQTYIVLLTLINVIRIRLRFTNDGKGHICGVVVIWAVDDFNEFCHGKLDVIIIRFRMNVDVAKSTQKYHLHLSFSWNGNLIVKLDELNGEAYTISEESIYHCSGFHIIILSRTWR